MSYKWTNQKLFHINDEYFVSCEQQRTSYGFRHRVSLIKNGHEISTGKCTYHNRTWEKYTYQSTIYEAIKNADLTDEVRSMLNEWTKEGKEPLKEEMSGLKTVGLVAMMGELLCDSQEDQNKWKRRMLSTVHGIGFPEDFNELSEDEKQKRLDKAISVLNED